MERYYEIIIRMVISTDKGDKAVNETYLVHDVSTVAAEAKISKEFEDYQYDWEVKSIKETKIVKVIE